MHCHNAFHISEGFGQQFLERANEIVGTTGGTLYVSTGCSNWNAFATRRLRFESLSNRLGVLKQELGYAWPAACLSIQLYLIHAAMKRISVQRINDDSSRNARLH
jgi:hypothetical protein